MQLWGPETFTEPVQGMFQNWYSGVVLSWQIARKLSLEGTILRLINYKLITTWYWHSDTDMLMDIASCRISLRCKHNTLILLRMSSRDHSTGQTCKPMILLPICKFFFKTVRAHISQLLVLYTQESAPSSFNTSSAGLCLLKMHIFLGRNPTEFLRAALKLVLENVLVD